MWLESIRSDQLCTWDGASSPPKFLGGGQVALAKWLRFEDQPYLPSAFDRIIQGNATRSRRIWFQPPSARGRVPALAHRKDAPNDLHPVSVALAPGRSDQEEGRARPVSLRCPGTEAEFNPALRHYLRQLYDIRLPETVDLERTSIEQIHADIAAQINRTEPGVTLLAQ